MKLDKKYAILIDSDNVSKKYIKGIFEEILEYGDIPIRRIYGDFKNNGWREICLEYSIKQIQQFNYTTGKNATDSMMIIDAMDLLYKEEYLDGFIIVSSDSDFTGLCQRIRESNKEVVGMGEKKTPKPTVSACTSFKYLENFLEEEVQTKDIRQDDQIIIKIKEIISISENPVLISQLKEQIIKLYNDFDVKNYGFNNMSKFLASIPGLVVSKDDDNTTLRVSSYLTKEKDVKDIEDIITRLINKNSTKKINLGKLQEELRRENITYKASGFSKFSAFINSMPAFKVQRNHVLLNSMNEQIQ